MLELPPNQIESMMKVKKKSVFFKLKLYKVTKFDLVVRGLDSIHKTYIGDQTF
jgi:hypothetical protein